MIEIMVGMVISLLIILAATGFYKVYGKLTYGTNGLKSTSEQLAQLSNAFNTTSMKIQNAGYGLTTPTINTHIKLYSNASLNNGTFSGTLQTIGTTQVTGNAVLWVENIGSLTSANYQCRGFISNSTTKVISYLYQTSCSTLSSSGWTSIPITTIGILPNAISFSAQQSNTPCSPYGAIQSIGLSNSGLIMTISTQSSFKSHSFKSCLLNF